MPRNTLAPEVAERPGGGRPPLERAAVWAARPPASRWQTSTRRDGAPGPRQVRALQRRVQTKDEGGHVGPAETLGVLRRLGGAARTGDAVSNARRQEALHRLVGVQGARHRMEASLQEGKGEVGLGQYAVRSGVGWRHQVTLSLVALWFLTLQRRRLGGKNPGVDGGAPAAGVQPTAAGPAAGPGTASRGGQPRVAA